MLDRVVVDQAQLGAGADPAAPAARRAASAPRCRSSSAARSSVVMPSCQIGKARLQRRHQLAPLERDRRLGDRSGERAARPGRPPAPPPACRRAAAPHMTASPAEPMPSGWRGWAWALEWLRTSCESRFRLYTTAPAFGSFGSCVLDRCDLIEVFTLDAQPHGDRRGDEHRRIDAEQDSDRQRDGEVVQGRAAEDEHRQHHHLGRAVGDDGAADRAA